MQCSKLVFGLTCLLAVFLPIRGHALLVVGNGDRLPMLPSELTLHAGPIERHVPLSEVRWWFRYRELTPEEMTNAFSPVVNRTPEEMLLAVSGIKFPTRNKKQTVVTLDETAVIRHLEDIAAQVNQEKQDALFRVENNRVVEFQAHREGRTLDQASAIRNIAHALAHADKEVPLPVTTAAPAVRLGDLNALGIKDLLGEGISDFKGSSRSRIQNIEVGSRQFRGLLITPGETFSFNQGLGPVTAKAGYLPEIVIKPEGLTPELGGGICQVATTAFRAAFFSGLPIPVRKNHSLNVSYYKWPYGEGLDATVYPPTVDLKFQNDTSSHIMIWTRVEGTRLIFEFWGTKDDRTVAMEGPVQYDRKSGGAVKATVVRKIERNGEIVHTDEFKSNYRSVASVPKLYGYPKSTESTTATTAQPATDAPQAINN
jgi:vancomycin resistance protein YoaR